MLADKMLHFKLPAATLTVFQQARRRALYRTVPLMPTAIFGQEEN